MSEALNDQGDERQQGPPSPSTSDDEEETGHAARVDWRMDPEESLSDWTIEISVDGSIHETYHVHRATLCVGSQYFARLFANKCLNEHETSTSRIELQELAAENFPHMLGYLYSMWDTTKKPITTENAVSLHYFGRYFEIRGLRKEARTFWKNNMTVDQAGTYLEHAGVFHDDKVYDAVTQKCFASLDAIQVDSRLLEVSSTTFWIDILRENKGASNPHLSTLVSSFCFKNIEILDTEAFLELTDKSVLPDLSTAAAMELLQLEKVFVPTSPSASELSCLQERSLETLTSCGDEDQQILVEFQQHCTDLPPLIVSLMLQRSIAKLWDSNTKNQEIETKLWDYKKNLETEATSCMPQKIVVLRAGRDEVNGIYFRTTKVGKMPSYVMNGKHEGWGLSPVKFQLYFANLQDNSSPWCRSWIIASVRDSNHGTAPIYRSAPVSEASSRLPPPHTGWDEKLSSTGWVKTTRGPTLSCLF